MNMLGLRSHIVRAEDIHQVATWYEKVFGKEAYFQNESYIGFEVEWFEFWVFKIFPWEEVAIWKNVTVYWGVEDIETEFQRIQSLWAKKLSDIVDVWGGIKMGELEDPFGNFFGIIYNPNFSAK